MLATMRPAPIHSTDASTTTTNTKQTLSHQSSSTNKQASSSKVKQSNQMNKPAPPTASRAKKGSGGRQIAPGLLSLSKPIGDSDEADEKVDNAGSEKKSKKNKKNAGSGTATPTNTMSSISGSSSKKKKALAIDEIRADENLLSRSAPDSHASSDWDMPNSARDATSTNSSALTWQQQLLNSQPSKPTASEKKKGGKKEKASASSSSKSKNIVNHSNDANQTDSATSAMTWQQELFGSNSKARGTAFDVFADNKDAITFGGGSAIANGNGKGSKKKQRERADSLGDYRIPNNAAGAKHNKAKGGQHVHVNNHGAPHIHVASGGDVSSSPSSGPPSTPNKLAYAGPNFHNSPSPASLPVPKFLQGKGNGNGEHANATSNSSIFAREAQAQAQAQAQQQQQQFSTQYQPNYPSYYAPQSQANPMVYGTNAYQVDPNVSISSSSSNSSEDDGNGSFAHMSNKPNSRYTRGVTAPPELPSTPNLNNGVGDESVNSVNGDRNFTIENLLAKMMRPGSD